MVQWSNSSFLDGSSVRYTHTVLAGRHSISTISTVSHPCARAAKWWENWPPPGLLWPGTLQLFSLNIRAKGDRYRGAVQPITASNPKTMHIVRVHFIKINYFDKLMNTSYICGSSCLIMAPSTLPLRNNIFESIK